MSIYRSVIFIKPRPVEVEMQAEGMNVSQQSLEHLRVLLGYLSLGVLLGITRAMELIDRQSGDLGQRMGAL